MKASWRRWGLTRFVGLLNLWVFERKSTALDKTRAFLHQLLNLQRPLQRKSKTTAHGCGTSVVFWVCSLISKATATWDRHVTRGLFIFVQGNIRQHNNISNHESSGLGQNTARLAESPVIPWFVPQTSLDRSAIHSASQFYTTVCSDFFLTFWVQEVQYQVSLYAMHDCGVSIHHAFATWAGCRARNKSVDCKGM